MNDQLSFILSDYLDCTKLKAIYEEAYPAYDSVLQSVYKKVRDILEEHGIFPTIKYRIKRFDAYFDKLLKLSRNKKGNNAAAITDILGLRIVCPFLEDLGAIENLIKTGFNVVELERKGSQHSFSEFGYDSVHLLIRLDPLPLKELPHTAFVCEVQLRTTLQDAWAEVEHELIYKSDITLPNESIRRKLASLNAILTLSDLIFQEIRDYQKEIREHDRKRRESLEVKIADTPGLEAHPPAFPDADRPVIPPVEIDSIIGQANLEKALLAALESHSSGDLENAVQIYTSILRLKIKDRLRALVYNHRGMAYFGMARYTRALHDFSKSIAYDAENTRCYNNRALTYRLLKRFDKSLKDYDRSIAVNPGQLDSFWGRAQTFCEMKLYTQAIADCEKVLSIRSDFTPALSFIKRLNGLIFQ